MEKILISIIYWRHILRISSNRVLIEKCLNCRIVDNLPCATKFELLETAEVQYEHGYRLGFVKDNTVSMGS